MDAGGFLFVFVFVFATTTNYYKLQARLFYSSVDEKSDMSHWVDMMLVGLYSLLEPSAFPSGVGEGRICLLTFSSFQFTWNADRELSPL